MKIGLVSPYDLAVSGGVNSHIRYLAANYRALGHQVRLIAPSSDLAGLDDETIVIGQPLSIPAGGSIARMTMSPRLGGLVQRVLREEALDVVHVHEPLASFLTVQFLRFARCTSVGTFHAARDSRARLYSYTRRLLKDAFRHLDGKIAVSRAAMRLVAPHFPGYYNVIPNGVDVARFSTPVPPLPDLDDGMVNILSVGRLEERKGQRYLLRAFAEVKASRPNARLVIVGGYSERQRRAYETWVRDRGLRDVVFAGFVSDEALPRYHRSAQIFCAPNTGNESQGIVLLEAMAAGRPVVASDIEGFAEVVTPGVDGLLVRPKDAEALAAALVELIDEPERRAAIAAAGRERVEDFSWERISRRVLSYYERLDYERNYPRPRAEPVEA